MSDDPLSSLLTSLAVTAKDRRRLEQVSPAWFHLRLREDTPARPVRVARSVTLRRRRDREAAAARGLGTTEAAVAQSKSRLAFRAELAEEKNDPKAPDLARAAPPASSGPAASARGESFDVVSPAATLRHWRRIRGVTLRGVVRAGATRALASRRVTTTKAARKKEARAVKAFAFGAWTLRQQFTQRMVTPIEAAYGAVGMQPRGGPSAAASAIAAISLPWTGAVVESVRTGVRGVVVHETARVVIVARLRRDVISGRLQSAARRRLRLLPLASVAMWSRAEAEKGSEAPSAADAA